MNEEILYKQKAKWESFSLVCKIVSIVAAILIFLFGRVSALDMRLLFLYLSLSLFALDAYCFFKGAEIEKKIKKSETEKTNAAFPVFTLVWYIAVFAVSFITACLI